MACLMPWTASILEIIFLNVLTGKCFSSVWVANILYYSVLNFNNKK